MSPKPTPATASTVATGDTRPRSMSPFLWLRLQPQVADEDQEMFEDSDLIQRDTLVLRATAPPDAQFSGFPKRVWGGLVARPKR